MVVNKTARLNLSQLETQPRDLAYVNYLETTTGVKERCKIIRRMTSGKQGQCVFVDDVQWILERWRSVMQDRLPKLAKKAVYYDFDEAYRVLLNNKKIRPAMFIIDIKEGSQQFHTGPGMARAILASPRFKGIPVLLYSTRSPNDALPKQSMRPIDLAIQIKDIGRMSAKARERTLEDAAKRIEKVVNS